MRFTDMAQQAFSFLEGIGFRLSLSDPARLQYESTQTFVTIEWDARSGELNAFIGLQARKGELRDAFSLRDLLAMENVDVPERKMPFQVADETKLGPFIDQMAEDTRVHAQLALAGDRMFFRRLETFRSAQADVYMRDMELRRVRTEADKAWQRRELDKLIALYTSIEDQLSASEKAKLAYAREHQAH
jgi:hypothetical protein